MNPPLLRSLRVRSSSLARKERSLGAGYRQIRWADAQNPKELMT